MATQLRTDIITMINSNDDTIVNIKNILQPISQFINSPVISQNIDQIVTILLTDRNNDKKFDVNDLKMLSEDPFVIMHLVTLLLMILTAVPSLHITVDVNESEIVVFKLLMYVFLVIIPNKTTANWTTEEKLTILDLALLIFTTMQSSQMVKNGLNKIASYVKSSKYCCCLTLKSEVVEDKVPDATVELSKAVVNARNIKSMQDQIKRLETIVDKK
jgi:hypothetical protein